MTRRHSSSQHRYSPWAPIASVFLVFGATLPAWSSTIAPADVVQTVGTATAVVHATAISSSSHWNETRSLIVTDTQFQVHETLKGDPASAITVRVPGGRIGKLLVEVPGITGFATGDEVVLALTRDQHGAFCVTGGGRWDVTTDSHHGKVVHGAQVQIAHRGTRMPAVTEAGAAEAPQSLSGLLQDLRDVIRASPASGGR